MQRVGPHHVIAVAEGVVIFIARSTPSPAMIRQFEQTIRSAAERSSAPVGLLHVAVADLDTGPPDDALRQEVTAMLGRSARFISAAAVVILKEGFTGAAIRAIITGFRLVHRPTFPTGTFVTIPDSVKWLASNLRPPQGQAGHAAALSAAIDGLMRVVHQER